MANNSPAKPFSANQQQQNGAPQPSALNQSNSINTTNTNPSNNNNATTASNNNNNNNVVSSLNPNATTNNNQPLANMASFSANNHSQSPSPLHFNSNNNNNNSQAQQQQQVSYVASSPKHNHHQNLSSPVNYIGSTYVTGNNPVSSGSGGLGSDSGSNSNLSYPANFVSFITTANSVVNATNSTTQSNSITPTNLALMTVKSSKSVQTDITTNQMIDSASAIETKNTRIDELIKEKEDLTKDLINLKRDYEKQGFSFKKCLGVNKKLLIEKSTLEKKQARQKCMENRLRLGQFVTQRQGATFVENWVDGSAFNDIMK